MDNSPVIAAVKNIDMLEAAINSPCEIIFMLSGDIFNLADAVRQLTRKER